jgi:hypothetical protein
MKDNKTDQLKKLKNIAGVSSAGSGGDEASYMAELTKKEIGTFLSMTKEIDPISRIKLFKEQGFTLNSLTRDTYYEAMGFIHPGGKEAVMSTIKDNIQTKMSNLVGDEEREGFLRDSVHTLPSEMLGEVYREFTAASNKLDSKKMEKMRAAQILETQELLSRHTDISLDPNKSLEAHTQSVLKAYENGYGEIMMFKDGELVVPGDDGELRPGYSLEHNPSPEDAFMLQVDIVPIIREKLKPHLQKARKALREDEVKNNELMMNSLTKFPDDIKNNIIIDNAMEKQDPAVIHEGIYNIISEKIKKGNTMSTQDIVDFYRFYKDKAVLGMSERVADGRAE